MFARLNATGEKLTPQELRNARFFGELKTLVYALALEQLDRWRDWRIFSGDQISRMKEVELTSDLVMNMMKGLTGKTQSKLNAFYKELDETFNGKAEVKRRFRHTMNELESLLDRDIAASAYTSDVHFFTLFVYLYDRIYGLGSPLTRRSPRSVPKALRTRLKRFS